MNDVDVTAGCSWEPLADHLENDQLTKSAQFGWGMGWKFIYLEGIEYKRYD
jgi:hypothetical protein